MGFWSPDPWSSGSAKPCFKSESPPDNYCTQIRQHEGILDPFSAHEKAGRSEISDILAAIPSFPSATEMLVENRVGFQRLPGACMLYTSHQYGSLHHLIKRF